MMFEKINVRFMILISLAVIYNFFFWNEKLGLNLVSFSLLTAAAIIFLNPASFNKPKVIILSIIVLFTAVTVLMINSGFSKFALFISIWVLAGYAHQHEIRSLFSAFATGMVSYLMIPAVFIEGIAKGKSRSRTFRFVFRFVKLAVIPILVFIMFYSMYVFASTKFDFYSNIVLREIGDSLYKVFKDYPFIRFMFILLGFILLTGVLYNSKIPIFKDLDLKFLEKLSRSKSGKLIWLAGEKKYVPVIRKIGIVTPRNNSLLTEQKIGVILLILVNILTLSFNIVDIEFLWLSFDPAEIKGFSVYVHEGAYILIFSIVLSMLILMYYFRGNINFYRKNRTIKCLAYLWIMQNAFMAISVGLRNYYYVLYTHTISYKKIGLAIYLFLVLVGLITMILKVRQRRTAYNIFKINAWSVYIALLVMCSFNWDRSIAEYNLANPKTNDIDIAYLLELSDDVLPVLNERKELTRKDFFIPRNDRSRLKYAEDYFERRVERFKQEQAGYSWLSWNYSDHIINEYFRNIETGTEK